jgi:hypothetical protein
MGSIEQLPYYESLGHDAPIVKRAAAISRPTTYDRASAWESWKTLITNDSNATNADNESKTESLTVFFY